MIQSFCPVIVCSLDQIITAGAILRLLAWRRWDPFDHGVYGLWLIRNYDSSGEKVSIARQTPNTRACDCEVCRLHSLRDESSAQWSQINPSRCKARQHSCRVKPGPCKAEWFWNQQAAQRQRAWQVWAHKNFYRNTVLHVSRIWN